MSLLTMASAGALIVVVPLAAQDSPASKGSEPSRPAVYTSDQAARGEALYVQACGTCHGPREFAGRLFETKWAGQPVEKFFSFIREKMPDDNPGGLTAQQYSDALAHVLSLNGFPAGNVELQPDLEALKSIQF
jgi:mono/diheme cytochrome c family protein